MAGLDPAIHADAPQGLAALARSAARACKCKGFWAVAAYSRALDAPNRVGGRVKSGHDAKPLGDLSDAPELIVTNS